MIEKIVRDYLNDTIDAPVYTEESGKMPKEYVLIEKTGGSRQNHISSSVITIQSYSVSRYMAADLSEKVKEAMEDIVTLDEISKCSLNSDYNYTDVTRKKERYQAVYDIVHY